MKKISIICALMTLLGMGISGFIQAESLWDPSSKDSLFFDPSAKQIGDILTVIVVESTSASRTAKTTTNKSSSAKGGVSDFFGNSNALGGNLNWDVSHGSDYEGGGTTTGGGTFTAKIAVRIIETSPNGYYIVEGSRKILINEEEQTLVLSGVVRPEDIRWDNTIFSSQMGDFDLKYMGKGPINEKQRPGLLTRVLDWLWIF